MHNLFFSIVKNKSVIQGIWLKKTKNNFMWYGVWDLAIDQS